MFDKYHFPVRIQDPRSVVRIDTTELRAPTDDSVRLLAEFEDAARRKIIETLALKNTLLEARVIRWEDPLNMRSIFSIHYKLNGSNREVKCACNDDKIEDRVKEIYEALAKDIAHYLLTNYTKGVKVK